MNCQRGHAASVLQTMNEVTVITDAFRKNGIRYAIFKGFALAAELYGTIAGREFNDTDIIVDEENVQAVEQILQTHGYAAKCGSAEFRSAFQYYQRQYMFVSERSDVAIEIHWDFVGSGDSFPLRSTDIWDTLRCMKIAGREIPTLGSNELAIFLCGHGTKERWRSLGWISDFAQFAAQNPDLDWVGLYDRAKVNQCGRSVLSAGALASSLLGLDFDASFTDLFKADLVVQERVARVVKYLQDPAASVDQYPWSDLSENWSNRLRALWVLLSTRTTGDYEAMPLPAQLWRLYHVTRPIRLGMKALFAASRRGVV
jgi:hypothetical protein